MKNPGFPKQIPTRKSGYCGWAKSISHKFETMVESIARYLQGNQSILGFLNGGEMDFATIHSTWVHVSWLLGL